MKLKKSGQVLLALVVSLGLCFGLTSCVNDYTVAYFYVTGIYQNQIGGFKIANNTGNLSAISSGPFGANGVNPIRTLVSSTGRYIYVLNAGKATTDASGNTTYQSANISVFSVGGNGVLAFQQSYTSQGFGATRFGLSSTGAYLYVMDEYSPAAGGLTGYNGPQGTQPPNMPCLDANGVYHPTGDLTAFTVDNTTGRLSLITNNQVQNPDGTSLSYFPVGCQPIDLKVTGGNIFVADTSDPTNGNKFTIFPYALTLATGQLTTTQNTEFVTGASSISAIASDAGIRYMYVLDPLSNLIWYYTVGSNGLLQAVNQSPQSNSNTAAGNPIALTTDSKSKFLYVANAGPSGAVGQVNSDITAYSIAANGVITPLPTPTFKTGSGPQCILEDPSNQYLYTADFNTNTVTGKVLDPNSGFLTDLRNQNTYPTVNTPTWCVADGHTN